MLNVRGILIWDFACGENLFLIVKKYVMLLNPENNLFWRDVR